MRIKAVKPRNQVKKKYRMKNNSGENIFNNNVLAIIILCCLGIGIYCNSFYSPFYFDDDSSIIKNLNIKNLENLRLIWDFWPTRFITYLSIAFNYHLHQLRVFGYHLFNFVIHLCTAILVRWFILLTFTTPAMKKDKIRQHANLIAFFAAGIFISHPIQTQAVTYIVQRATGLAALFYLLSFCLYIKSRILGIEENDSKLNYRFYYFASLMITLAGMFTKELVITLPLAIIVYELCFFKIQAGLKWKKILPFFIVSLIIPLTMAVTNSINFREMKKVSEYTPNMHPWNYLLTQFKVMITYLRLLFLPLKQNLDYDYPIAKTLLEPATMFSFLLLLIILVIAIRIFYKYRLVAFSVFWFFLILLPESSVIPINDVIVEHRLYLPMLGYSIFLVSLLHYIVKNKTLRVIILILIIQGYAFMTYSRNSVWQDEIILGKDIVRKSPKKARAYVHLGTAYMRKRIYSPAIDNFIRAIEIAPDYSDAYYNLGAIYYEKNDFDKAIFYFNKAIQTDPMNLEANYYRGMSFNYKKEYGKAISDFKQVLHINAGYIDAYRPLANAYSAINEDNE